jgi:glycine/D-amino acid oxidase-like deaminating enzyme
MRHADVAVVGGGILGCSAALHLKLRDAGRVVLIERDAIGAGTTSAGAGLLARWSAGFVPAWGDDELALESYGLDFYRELSRGHRLGHRATGMLFIGSARASGRRGLQALAHRDGGAVLTPGEVERLTHGFIRAKGVAGGVFDPRGARVSAAAAARALARSFSTRGGVALEHEPVGSVRRRRAGGFVLETSAGPLACESLVVAAGAWTNAVLRRLGTWLPLVPLVATRLTTEPVPTPEALPAIQFCDGRRLYVRDDDGRLTWGCGYERPPRYALVDREAPHRRDGLEADPVPEMEGAARELTEAIPALGRTGTIRAVHGAPCYTPDLRPLIGELPSQPGLFVVAGDNYAGVTHAPAAGRLLAELVTGARDTSVDPRPYRPERFDDEYRTEAEVVSAMRLTGARTALAASRRAA